MVIGRMYRLHGSRVIEPLYERPTSEKIRYPDNSGSPNTITESVCPNDVSGTLNGVEFDWTLPKTGWWQSRNDLPSERKQPFGWSPDRTCLKPILMVRYRPRADL